MMKGGVRVSGSVTKQPKISIITVVLNGIKFIEAYFDHIIPFLNSEIELIMVDGSSTDGTVEIIKRNNNQIDYWQSEPDTGIYHAMNKGVELASGQWLYFMGVDDTLLPEFNSMLPLLNNQQVIYYGNVMSYGKLLAKAYDTYFLTKLNICHQAIIYPQQVFKKYRYNLQYLVYADYYLNLQCWHDPDFTFLHCDLLVASFPGGGFSTYTKDIKFEQDRDILFQNYLGKRAYYRYINRTKGTLNMLKQLMAL